MLRYSIVMRLNKFLAEAGIASRRGSDEIIRAGRVTVNGHKPEEMGVQVDPESDEVKIDGRMVTLRPHSVYCMLNKPVGYLTTVTDPHGRKTVMELLKDIPERIYPVGRLDFDTDGLLLITNDGSLSNALTHPRYQIEKEYRVDVNGNPTPDQLRILESGILLDGRLTGPAKINKDSVSRRKTSLLVTVTEGRKRQIRLMFRHIGFEVNGLTRLRIGPIHLGNLKDSCWRYLKETEVKELRSAAGTN